MQIITRPVSEIVDAGRSILQETPKSFGIILAAIAVALFIFLPLLLVGMYFLVDRPSVEAYGIMLLVPILAISLSLSPTVLMSFAPLLVSGKSGEPSSWHGDRTFWSHLPRRFLYWLLTTSAYNLVSSFLMSLVVGALWVGPRFYQENFGLDINFFVPLLLVVILFGVQFILFFCGGILMFTLPAREFVQETSFLQTLYTEFTSFPNRLWEYWSWSVCFLLGIVICTKLSGLSSLVSVALSSVITTLAGVGVVWWYCSAFVREVRRLQANQ